MRFHFITIFCLLLSMNCNIDQSKVISVNHQSTDIPVRRIKRDGNFLVTIGFGTPEHLQSLVIDTGSDLTWIQCEPCNHCFPQDEPIFDPLRSSSYDNVVFNSAECKDLMAATKNRPKRSSPDDYCIYTSTYADKSSSKGLLAKERIILTGGTKVDFYFGCGTNNGGTFDGEAGILGLGREKLSFPSQTATRYNEIFSYCLTSTRKEYGYLTFGRTNIPDSVKYTPMIGEELYGISIEEITVDGKRLDIPLTVFSNAGAIIDSGSVFTYLPPRAYSKLKTTFMAMMSQYPRASEYGDLDTCYNLKGHKKVKFPSVGFRFSGGASIEIDPKIGVVYRRKRSQVCLAFASTEKSGVKSAIFGNYQQRRLLVVYDREQKQIGFAPNSCK